MKQLFVVLHYQNRMRCSRDTEVGAGYYGGLVLELKTLKNPNLGDSSNGITIVAAFRERHLSVADRLDGRLSRAEGRASVGGVNERVPRATQ